MIVPAARMTDVLALMAQIGEGTVTVEDAAPRLQRLLVPRTARVSPVGDAMALLEREQDDSLPPYTPNSRDDVRRARDVHRWITEDHADALADLVEIPLPVRSNGRPSGRLFRPPPERLHAGDEPRTLGLPAGSR